MEYLIFKNFPSSFGIKFTCNAPEISTLQKSKKKKKKKKTKKKKKKKKKKKATRNKILKTEIDHGSTFCATVQFSLGYFLSKKNNCTYSAP